MVSLVLVLVVVVMMMELQRVLGGSGNRGESDTGYSEVLRRLLVLMQMQV